MVIGVVYTSFNKIFEALKVLYTGAFSALCKNTRPLAVPMAIFIALTHGSGRPANVQIKRLKLVVLEKLFIIHPDVLLVTIP